MTSRWRGTLSVVVAMASAPAAAATPCESNPEMATEFGLSTTWGVNLKTSSGAQKLILSKDVRWVRTLLRTDDAPSEWTIVIRDGAGRPLQNIAATQLEKGRPFWTDRLPSNALSISLNGGDAATTVRLMEYVAMDKNAPRPYYSIQGSTENWEDLFSSGVDTVYKSRGDAVGMFVTHFGSNMGGFRVWSCSGFLVASTPKLLFVTNDHCGGPWNLSDRWSAGVCQNATIDFSWDGDPVDREYACRKVERRDPVNDLAVLELVPRKTEAPPRTLTLRDTPLTEEQVAVIHHPAGLAKKISSNCQAVTSAAAPAETVKLERDFAHRCDTEGGSSGAPVLDAAGSVVGVHHMGFEKNLAGTCDMFNKAIRTPALVELLRQSPALQGFQVK